MLNNAGNCGISVGEMLHFILFLCLQRIPGRKVKADFVAFYLLSCPSCITLKPILNTNVNSKFFGKAMERSDYTFLNLFAIIELQPLRMTILKRP